MKVPLELETKSVRGSCTGKKCLSFHPRDMIVKGWRNLKFQYFKGSKNRLRKGNGEGEKFFPDFTSLPCDITLVAMSRSHADGYLQTIETLRSS